MMTKQEIGKLLAPSGRWRVETTYRNLGSPLTFVFYVDEIEDLQAVMENGPDWNGLESIQITYTNRDSTVINIVEFQKQLDELKAALEG